jgi:hypothetical protein
VGLGHLEWDLKRRARFLSDDEYNYTAPLASVKDEKEEEEEEKWDDTEDLPGLPGVTRGEGQGG